MHPYYKALKVRQWLEGVTKYLNPDPHLAREWKSALASYYSDLFNFPEKEESLISKLLQTLSEKSGKELAEIKDYLHDQSSEIKEVCPHHPLTVHRQGVHCRLQLGGLQFRLPLKRYESLILKGQEEFLNLLLRYDPFLPETGLFWSLSPEIYQRFLSFYPEALECFASPLNNNIDRYCSPFEEDEVFGSLGPFFPYLQKSSELRGVINPPYTEAMLERTCEEIEAFLDRGSGTFLLMYPDWVDNPYIKRLTERPRMRVSPELERSGISLYYREHLIVSAESLNLVYDHQLGKIIHPPVRLILCILSNEDVKVSLEALLNNGGRT